MALSGFVSREDRATRLVMTKQGFVTAVRRAPQDYDVFMEGVRLGRAVKFKHWYPEVAGDKRLMWQYGDGSRFPQSTRQAAIEWVVKHHVRTVACAEPHGALA